MKTLKTGVITLALGMAAASPAGAMGLGFCFGDSPLTCDPEADSAGVKMCQYKQDDGSWGKVYRKGDFLYHHYPTPNAPSGGRVRQCLK